MGAAELSHATTPLSACHRRRRGHQHARRIAGLYAGVWTLTFLGALFGAVAPGLAPRGRPHPTLHGTLVEAASIAAANARGLSAPVLLSVFRFPASHRSRQLGDLLVGGLLAGNTLRVGLALGRWHTQLLPYVPQLPLEWLAAAIAVAAWLNLRTGTRSRTALAYAAAVLLLVAAAAAVEATATPHSSTSTHDAPVRPTTRALRPPSLPPVRKARGDLPSLRSCAGAGTRFKVDSLPFPRCRSVPHGRLTGAAGLHQSPLDPAKEGPQ